MCGEEFAEEGCRKNGIAGGMIGSGVEILTRPGQCGFCSKRPSSEKRSVVPGTVAMGRRHCDLRVQWLFSFDFLSRNGGLGGIGGTRVSIAAPHWFLEIVR